MATIGHAPGTGANSGLTADVAMDGAEFRGVPIAPSNCAIRLTAGRLWPVNRRVTPGVIPLGVAIYAIKGVVTLKTVQWSRFPGGNKDNTPPCGTQVVGPIEYEGGVLKRGGGSQPAATVYIYAKNDAGYRL